MTNTKFIKLSIDGEGGDDEENYDSGIVSDSEEGSVNPFITFKSLNLVFSESDLYTTISI